MQIVFVNNHATIFFMVEGHTKTSLNVYVLAIESAKHGAYHSLLAGGSAQEVVKDVWHDYGVNEALQLLNMKTKI